MEGLAVGVVASYHLNGYQAPVVFSDTGFHQMLRLLPCCPATPNRHIHPPSTKRMPLPRFWQCNMVIICRSSFDCKCEWSRRAIL